MEPDKPVNPMEPIPERQVSRDEAVRYFVDEFGPPDWPEVRRNIEAGVEATIARLQKGTETGDQLWLCCSRHLGVLYGNRGLGIVRNGQIIRYESIVKF
jgi:hypothetical protein